LLLGRVLYDVVASMSYIIEPLEADTPGRGTYRCEICGRQAEFVTGREVEFDITVNDHRFNEFDNISMLGPESYVCSEACFTMWIFQYAVGKEGLGI